MWTDCALVNDLLPHPFGVLTKRGNLAQSAIYYSRYESFWGLLALVDNNPKDFQLSNGKFFLIVPIYIEND